MPLWPAAPADRYAELAAALAARDCHLLTSPAAYRTAHELPGWYGAFEPLTPASAWLPCAPGRPSGPTAVRRSGLRFVTTDLALRSDGAWRVVEVGDGQVSGLPAGADPGPLYRALAAAPPDPHRHP
ncbi:ATP-grasp domain-containing protein [Streptomyces noursei]|nr:ATP-grasp domain-containing protein [Streptomyces noursei]